MLVSYSTFFVIMIMSGLFSFGFNYMHLLSSLLSLEFVSLGLYGALVLNFTVLSSDIFFILYFLVMVVCEGVLGLSLLVSLTYTYSLDFMKLFNSLMC